MAGYRSAGPNFTDPSYERRLIGDINLPPDLEKGIPMTLKGTTMKHKTMKILAAVTAAGVLTVGGASAAFAADGGSTAAVGERTNRPHVLRQGLRLAFTTAADTLGLTAQELREQVKSGPQSIASVAGDQTDEVTAAIVAALSARIDEAVANGNVSAARADQAKSRLPDAAQRFVNRVPGQHAQQ